MFIIVAAERVNAGSRFVATESRFPQNRLNRFKPNILTLMKLYFPIMAVAAMAISIAGCGGSGGGGSTNANVTVNTINVKYGAPGMSTQIDGSYASTSLQYGRRVVFKLAAGSHQFDFRLTDSSTIDYTKTDTFIANTRQNYLVLFDGIYIDAPNLTPSATELTLRFVDARKLDTPVDVYVTNGGTDLASPVQKWTGVEYKDAAKELKVGVGPYRVIVTSTGTSTVISDSGRLTPGGGSETLCVLQLADPPAQASLGIYTSKL